MTKIEWTEKTWNPVIGCTRVSAGCQNCYAVRIAARLAKNPVTPQYEGVAEFTPTGPRWLSVKCLPEKLAEPLRRRKPTMYFVNSMSDLFHEDVPFDFITAVFGVMAACPQHTFQVLTKRPERMIEFFDSVGTCPDDCTWPLRNVWLGVTVESSGRMHRVDDLKKVPAEIRFISMEPLLGPIPRIPLDGIGWVIVGAETGPGARPMELEWARDIRDQCREADVPFFMKKVTGGGERPADLQIRKYPM